jgi:Zn-finger nucleic acid-binding protein
MNCNCCGAAMRTENGLFKCDYCHNIIVPEKDDDGVSVTTDADGESCPVCAITLMKATLGHLPLLYCTKCDGMAISMDELQDLIAASRAVHPGTVAPSAANPADLRRRIACPHCRRPMEAHYYGGPGNVVIDTCENCSLNWLDHGELARIAQAPQSDYSPDATASDPGYPKTSQAVRPDYYNNASA